MFVSLHTRDASGNFLSYTYSSITSNKILECITWGLSHVFAELIVQGNVFKSARSSSFARLYAHESLANQSKGRGSIPRILNSRGRPLTLQTQHDYNRSRIGI